VHAAIQNTMTLCALAQCHSVPVPYCLYLMAVTAGSEQEGVVPLLAATGPLLPERQLKDQVYLGKAYLAQAQIDGNAAFAANLEQWIQSSESFLASSLQRRRYAISLKHRWCASGVPADWSTTGMPCTPGSKVAAFLSVRWRWRACSEESDRTNDSRRLRGRSSAT